MDLLTSLFAEKELLAFICMILSVWMVFAFINTDIYEQARRPGHELTAFGKVLFYLGGPLTFFLLAIMIADQH